MPFIIRLLVSLSDGKVTSKFADDAQTRFRDVPAKPLYIKYDTGTVQYVRRRYLRLGKHKGLHLLDIVHRIMLTDGWETINHSTVFVSWAVIVFLIDARFFPASSLASPHPFS